jgi:hypothetical protein
MLIERLSKCAGFLFAAIVLFDVSPAMAGFQWVPPPPEQPAMPAPQLSPVSPAPELSPAASSSPLTVDVTPSQPVAAATKNPEVITPIIIEGTPAFAQGAAVDTISQAPVPLANNDVLAAPPVLMPVTAPATVASAADVVQGFASQVPLTVALRELLPPGYGFSIDQDVDMGVLVSFQGGKPWRDTLAAALDPVGLVMHEQAQMISIGRIPAQAASMAQIPPAPLPAVAIQPASATLPAMTSTVASAAPVPAAQRAPIPAPIIITSSTPSMSATSSNPPAPSVTLAMTPSTPVKAMVATVPVATVEIWNAERGDSLRKVLQDWSHRVHAEVEWLAEYDYPLQASINYSGTYEEAVRNLLMGFEGAHPEPVAQLHINPELGQTVLVVRTRGNTSRD